MDRNVEKNISHSPITLGVRKETVLQTHAQKNSKSLLDITPYFVFLLLFFFQ